MKERPILFSTSMVQSILAGRKTQTRRIVKPQPVPATAQDGFKFLTIPGLGALDEYIVKKCPYGQAGDLLWVRETFHEVPADAGCEMEGDDNYTGWRYKATWKKSNYNGWKPSIHMPKAAARIWLQVKEVKVERLHDISEDDAIAEGVKKIGSRWFHYAPSPELLDYAAETGGIPICKSPIVSFASLWVSINGKENFDSNPWLWVIKYEVLSTNGRADAYAKLVEEAAV